jgi:hypothetical protein
MMTRNLPLKRTRSRTIASEHETVDLATNINNNKKKCKHSNTCKQQIDLHSKLQQEMIERQRNLIQILELIQTHENKSDSNEQSKKQLLEQIQSTNIALTKAKFTTPEQIFCYLGLEQYIDNFNKYWVEEEFELVSLDDVFTRYFYELTEREIAKFIPNTLGDQLELQLFIQKYNPNPKPVCECISRKRRLTINDVSFKYVESDPQSFTSIEEILKYCGLNEQDGFNEVMEYMNNHRVTFQRLFKCNDQQLDELTKHCKKLVSPIRIRQFMEFYRPIMTTKFIYK